jgi:hypothetical protein
MNCFLTNLIFNLAFKGSRGATEIYVTHSYIQPVHLVAEVIHSIEQGVF